MTNQEKRCKVEDILKRWGFDIEDRIELANQILALDTPTMSEDGYRKALKEILEWLRDCPSYIIDHDHGVPYDHIRIAEEVAKEALSGKIAKPEQKGCPFYPCADWEKIKPTPKPEPKECEHRKENGYCELSNKFCPPPFDTCEGYKSK